MNIFKAVQEFNNFINEQIATCPDCASGMEFFPNAWGCPKHSKYLKYPKYMHYVNFIEGECKVIKEQKLLESD